MLYCYPIPGNNKSLAICSAFAHGCNGHVVRDNVYRLGNAFFYGVNVENQAPWAKAHSMGYDWYYADNAYFDESRQKYFRITSNKLQHSGSTENHSNGQRLAKLCSTLDLHLYDWVKTATDAQIIVCPQSDSFMRMPAMYSGDWLTDTLRAIRLVTDRPCLVRPWQRDKTESSSSLVGDLAKAHALVTYSSAAAVTALMRGVPVVVSPASCAWPLSTRMADIEHPKLPADRLAWAGILADNQFTMDEMRNGYAWQRLVRN